MLKNNKTAMQYLSLNSEGIFIPKANFILCNEKEIDITIRLCKHRKNE